MTDLTVLSKLQEILEELRKITEPRGILSLPDYDGNTPLPAVSGGYSFQILETGETALGGALKVEKIESVSPEDENARRVVLLERRLTELDKTFRHIFGDGEEADAVEELVNQALQG